MRKIGNCGTNKLAACSVCVATTMSWRQQTGFLLPRFSLICHQHKCLLLPCQLPLGGGSWLAFELQYWDLFPITKRFVSPFLTLPSYKEADFKLPPPLNFHVIHSSSAVKFPRIPNTVEILNVNGILFKNCVMLLNQWRFMWYGKHCSTSLSWKKKHTKKDKATTPKLTTLYKKWRKKQNI